MAELLPEAATEDAVHEIMAGIGAAGVSSGAVGGTAKFTQGSPLNLSPLGPKSPLGEYEDASVTDEYEAEKWLAKALGNVLYNVGNIPYRAYHSAEQLATMGMDPRQVSDDPRAQTYDPSGFGDAMLLAAGGGPSTAERGAVGVFGGRVAADNLAAQGIGVPRRALEVAQDMAQQGASKEEIYKTTAKMMADAGLPYGGVSRDKLGKLVFEIPDEGLKVTQGGWTKLGDKVKHPELQKAYPRETRGEALAIKTRPGSPFSGQFNERWVSPLSGRINPAEIEANALTLDDLREVLAHEFDHFVGHIEGRAAGSSPHALMQQIEKVQPELSPEMREQVAWDMYHRNAGEVAARNAEKRVRMTPEMLQKYPPWLTEDIPPQDQLAYPQAWPYPKDARRPPLGKGSQPLHPEDELSTERLIAPMSPKVAEIAEIIKRSKAFRERGNNEMADLYQAAARAKAIEGGFEGDPMQWAWPGEKRPEPMKAERQIRLEKLETPKTTRGGLGGLFSPRLETFNVMRGDQPIARLELQQARSGRNLHVGFVDRFSDDVSPGHAAMRGVLEELKRQYPQAEVLTGNRMTGIRGKTGEEMVRLSLKDGSITVGGRASTDTGLQNFLRFIGWGTAGAGAATIRADSLASPPSPLSPGAHPELLAP